MHYRDCTQQEIVDAIAKWQDDVYGNYHTYDWKLVSLEGPIDILASNPDPVTGLGGHRYYAVLKGIDADGEDRQIHVSVNWIPQTEEFGRIKYSGSDPKEGYIDD